MTADLSCPSCKFEVTQRLSLVYENGYSDVHAVSRSIGLEAGDGGLGIGSSSVELRGTTQTAASLRAAPPTKRKYLRRLLYILGTAVVISLFVTGPILERIVALAWLGASIFYIRLTYKYNSKVWPSLYQQWARSYICTRCSHIFVA
jgi:hypothetical protein